MMSSHRTVPFLLSAALLVACGGPPGLAAEAGDDGAPVVARQQGLTGPNLLANASFDTVGPSGSSVTVITPAAGGAGPSAAAGWGMFTNTPGYIRTDLLPSTRRGGVGRMIRVLTRGNRNGIVQAFDQIHRGPLRANMTAWVFVVSGQVGVGVGDGGNTSLTRFSTVTGQWILLNGPTNAGLNANEIAIYTSAGPGEFYVDFAGVTSDELLSNPAFDSVGPCGTSTSYSTPPGQPFGGACSAAAGWSVWMNGAGTTLTELLPTTRPGSAGRMLHVRTTATNSGLNQVFNPVTATSFGPSNAQLSAWVYVLAGRVGIGAGDQGNTSISAATAPGAVGQWINLLTQNANSPANTAIIDSFGGPADFYIDEASIVAVP